MAAIAPAIKFEFPPVKNDGEKKGRRSSLAESTPFKELSEKPQVPEVVLGPDFIRLRLYKACSGPSPDVPSALRIL